MSVVSRNDDLGKLILRICCGGILLFHGVHKVFVEIDHVQVILQNAGLPAFFAYGNIVGEFIGPVMVLVGYKTRIGALLIAFNMLVSVLLAHADIIFAVNDFGGWMIETNMLYLLSAVALFFLGAGRFSISRGLGKWD